MCGIAGYYSSDKSVHPDCLTMMNRVLQHRGPDAHGVFADGAIGLAHTRLSILDLSSAANQPMTSACGNYVIVFNGEIYNFKELAKAQHLLLKTSSDTEVVVELFAKLGTKAFALLNGMFAGAILEKSTETLFLFRDKTGIKPLFYFKNNTSLFFASELKAIYAVKKQIGPLTTNQKAIQLFLHLGYIPQPYTIFEEISKFPSGSFAIVKDNVLSISSYYELDSLLQEHTIKNEKQTKETLHTLISESIKSQLYCDVPCGTFLSGGIDSSLVSAIAAKHSTSQLKTFSIGFTEGKYNESLFARNVASHIQSKHHEFTVSHKDAQQLIPQLFDSFDEPYADSSAIPTMLVSKMAREHVKMILSGDGGDELFMGYGAYRWAERFQHPGKIQLLKYAAAILGSTNDRYRRIYELLNTRGSTSLQTHIFSQEQCFFSEREIVQLFKHPCHPMAELINHQLLSSRDLSAAETQSLFDLQFYLKDDLLIKTDHASMLNSLEVRVPLLDAKIVDYSLNIDPHLKQHGKTDKYILKEVLYDYIPASFFNRPKWGFSIPLCEWLAGELSYLIDDYLSEEVIHKVNLVDAELTKLYIKKFRSGHYYLYNRLWNLILLHRWWLVHNNDL